jgi:hypothetical protein
VLSSWVHVNGNQQIWSWIFGFGLIKLSCSMTNLSINLCFVLTHSIDQISHLSLFASLRLTHPASISELKFAKNKETNLKFINIRVASRLNVFVASEWLMIWANFEARISSIENSLSDEEVCRSYSRHDSIQSRWQIAEQRKNLIKLPRSAITIQSRRSWCANSFSGSL